MENENIQIKNAEMGDLIQEFMGSYGTAVNLDRAIPSLLDGLKPVQRKILWTCYLHKLGSKAKHMKVVRIVGNAAAFHAHGPSSVEGAIVNMSQDWKMRVPLIDIQGNNGDIAGNRAAASRYIEGRMTKAAELMLKDINKGIVPMVPNYDNTEKEPFCLPSAYPNALANPVSGIGYGMATDILPHNPIELLELAIQTVDNPDMTTDEIFRIVPGPDFPTGGAIIGYQGSIDEINNGRASFVVRGHMKVEHEGKGKKQETLLIIDEVPFGVSTTKIVEQIGKILSDNPVLGATEVGDESIDGEMRLVTHFKDDSHIEEAMALFWRYSDMEIRRSVTNMMIDEGKPKVVSIRHYIKKWLKHRKSILKKELKFEKEKIDKRLLIIEGLFVLSSRSDEIIRDAKASNGRADFVKTLIEKYELKDEQAQAIANLQIYRLGKQDRDALHKEKSELDERLKSINEKLLNEDVFNEYLKSDMRETQKELLSDDHFNFKRKTKILEKVDRVDVNLRDLRQESIPEKPNFVVARETGIAQRMTPRVYDNNIESAKQEHNIAAELETKTTDWVMFFTNDGGVITRFVNDLPDVNPKYDGQDLHKEIPDFKAEHKIIGGTTWNDDIAKENLLLFSLTKYGFAKMNELNRSMPNTNTRRYFSRLTPFNGLKKRGDGDEVILTMIITQEDVKNKKIQLKLANGSVVEHDLSDISIQGQGGSGAAKMGHPGLDDFTEVNLIDK